jgi:hypothetical protein
MSGIEDLRQRVQDVEQRFGLAREEQAKYSTRLIGLIDEVEGRLRAQQAEIEQQQTTLAGSSGEVAKERELVGRLEHENEQLRAMLHSLLKAIETGTRGNFSEIMHTLEQKVTALISGDAVSSTVGITETVVEPENEAVAEITEAMEIAAEPEPEIAAEPEAAAEPVPEMAMEPEAEPVGEPEATAEPEPEMAAEPDLAAEAAVEPELEMAADPEPVPVAEPEAAAEAEPETVADAEPEPEMAAEAGTAVADETPAASNPTVDDLETAAAELAAAATKMPAPDADSLHEIMDRVSRLVREAEASGVAAPTAPPAAPPAAPSKKSAAG